MMNGTDDPMPRDFPKVASCGFRLGCEMVGPHRGYRHRWRAVAGKFGGELQQLVVARGAVADDEWHRRSDGSV